MNEETIEVGQKVRETCLRDVGTIKVVQRVWLWSRRFERVGKKVGGRC